MPRDLKRVSMLAVFFLVVLRMSIGWQFFYEGLWKHNTMSSPTPWTSEGYLKNARGPLRDFFRDMTGDPDDLRWLDYNHMSSQWDQWRDRFVAHYNLNEAQQARLDEFLNGKQQHTATVSAIPESARPLVEQMSSVLTYDADKKQLVVRGDTPLKPSEAAQLRAAVPVVPVPDGYAKADAAGEPLRTETGVATEPDPVDLEFFKAIESLQRESAKLGYRQRLAALLRGDPDRVGVLARLADDYRPEMAAARNEQAAEDYLWLHYGEIQVYQDLLREYENAMKNARPDFQQEQLNLIAVQIQAKKAELVGPIRALDKDLKRSAFLLLTGAQRQRGVLPPERTRVWQADQATIWGLLILGGLLIVGFLSRPAAFCGAAMLILFYLPVPPWPGIVYPREMLGTEHSYIINKNLIEAIALLALAALPTGRWFGVDRLVYWAYHSRKRRG